MRLGFNTPLQPTAGAVRLPHTVESGAGLTGGASVINCCYAARGIGVSSTTTKTVDCPDLTFSDTHRNVAGGKISLNVIGCVVSPACIPVDF
jgi:hypothetical protein